MKISARAEYACLAIIELARAQQAGQPMRVREIAEAQGIPGRYLVQILLQLKSAGLVRSIRGSVGGYSLIRRAEELTVADVMAVIEGPEEPPRDRASATARDLGEVLRRAHAAERVVLAGVTISQLVGRDLPHDYVL